MSSCTDVPAGLLLEQGQVLRVGRVHHKGHRPAGRVDAPTRNQRDEMWAIGQGSVISLVPQSTSEQTHLHGSKEINHPCLIYLHLISLVPQPGEETHRPSAARRLACCSAPVSVQPQQGASKGTAAVGHTAGTAAVGYTAHLQAAVHVVRVRIRPLQARRRRGGRGRRRRRRRRRGR